ncbi:non-ribosomal peptide synthetase [Gordonia phthalatica]|uniref:Carrier domain-containing protein n=1 Tax=Gordonia phthalatica TaxID=1136941 RepID=A0A0N9N2L0_9ACTN|nr:non-ribosomal peptide synthetase [Gordonia phthalatica]ALG84881.1 hypothetical protein ACH46_10690 [Gordonia phthalatica]
MRRLDLNRAQFSLWYAQQLLGDDVPLSIAQCLEITGPLHAGTLCRIVDEVTAEMEASTARLVTDADGPHLEIRSGTPSIVHRLSMADEPDPMSAAEAWMTEETEAPLPTSGPLIRCVLIHLGGDRWILYARAHHILLDGYGAGLLIRHAADRYRRAVDGDADERPDRGRRIPAPQSVAAILEHEERYRGSSREQLDRDHWRAAAIDDVDPMTVGDSDTAFTVRRHVVGRDLDRARFDGIGEVAGRAGVPTIVVLLAAGALLLARLRARRRVPLTLVTSARTSAALRAAPGTMSNLLPIIIDDDPDSTVDAHLRAVAATMSGALRHQQYRYEAILADAGRSGGGGLPVRIGPVVNILPAPPRISLGDGFDAAFRVLSTGPVADLNINVYPGRRDSLRVEIETNPAAHPARAGEALLAHLLAGVDALLLSDPDTLLGRLHLPASGSLDGPSVPADAPAHLADVYWSRRYSDRQAVVDGDEVLTHRQLAERAAGVTAELRARARPGDVVAVVCHRSVHTVIAAHAIAAAGMCVLPVDRALPEPRQRMMLDDADPAVILTERDLRACAPTGAGTVALATVPVGAPAYLLYTSGTTGSPKGIVVTHTGVAGLAATVDTAYGMDETSVVAHLASPGFDTAIVEMLAAARVGAALVVVPDHIRGGDELGDFLTRNRVTHLFITPAALATVPSESAETVSHLIVGGDVCPAPLMRRWARRSAVRCAYGPTETTCSVTLTGPIAADSAETSVPLGDPMVGVRLSVRDARLRPVPSGGDGDLYVSGPAVGLGVLNRPDATASRFVANPDAPGERMYRTGDRVRLDPNGGLRFLGRDDHQVKIRGVRVEPAEVDRIAVDSGLVSECVTVARRSDLGHRLHFYGVAAADVAADDLPRRLRAALTAALPAASVPSTFTVLDELPLTVNRKVDRGRLPAPQIHAASAYRGPRTETETVVVAAFEAALGRRGIGVDDDFFHLGGDSLIATAVAAHLSAAGLDVGVRDVFAAATPKRLAAQVRSGSTSRSARPVPSSDVPAPGVPVPLAPAQRDVYRRRHGIEHLIAFTIALPPTVDVAAIRAAVADLLCRHEMLRSVTTDDGQFVVDAAPDPAKWSIDVLDPANPEWARRHLHRTMDLAHRYPLRVGVAATDDRFHVAVAVHHLAVDGASLALLLSGLVGGGDAERATYREYAIMADARADERRAADVEHVRSTVDIDRILCLPAAQPRPPRWRSDGARVRARLSADRWTGLVDVAAERRVSVLTVLRAALATMLAADADTDTVTIGALVSGRDDGRFAKTVGMFVHTVPVPCPVAPTLAETVDAVRRAEDAAFSHSTTAFTTIVDALQADRPDRHPLFQVMLTVDDPLPTDAITPLPVPLAHCDLHFSVVPPRPDSPGHVELLYATALFDVAAASGLAEAFADRIGAT